MIGTYWDQENRNKTITNMNFKNDGIERREANTSIDLTKGRTMLVLNKSSP